MRALKILRRIFLALIVMLFLWLIVLGIDFFRMENGYPPLFSIQTAVHDDGSAVEYWGAGYKSYRMTQNGKEFSAIVPLWESSDSVLEQYGIS